MGDESGEYYSLGCDNEDAGVVEEAAWSEGSNTEPLLGGEGEQHHLESFEVDDSNISDSNAPLGRLGRLWTGCIAWGKLLVGRENSRRETKRKVCTPRNCCCCTIVVFFLWVTFVVVRGFQVLHYCGNNSCFQLEEISLPQQSVMDHKLPFNVEARLDLPYANSWLGGYVNNIEVNVRTRGGRVAFQTSIMSPVFFC
mmetsp:Transcript_21376/g.46607  ORF Transcript_21376/g.46607 Transcript_21376/m.46607 type:complete len:197 (+) Transcript_21376:326-916(+)